MTSDNPTTPLESLTRINLDDVIAAFGWETVRRGRRLLEWPFRLPATKFARLALDYDQDVARLGLSQGSNRFLRRLGVRLSVTGQENIPTSRPLLVLSNHPGMTDTLCLFSGIPRRDVRIVASGRAFLRSLVSVERQLIYVPEEAEGRLGVLRAVASHLRSGGTILTFPAGEIEPDPAVLPGAVESLQNWASSVGLFVRLTPDASIVPAIVSGVLAPQATFHIITRLRRTSKDRERLGAALQLMAMVLAPRLWPVNAMVKFTSPIPASDLIPLNDPAAITQAILDRLRPFFSINSNYPVFSPPG